VKIHPCRRFFSGQRCYHYVRLGLTPQKELLEKIAVPVLALSGDVDMLPGVDTSFFRKAAQAIANMVQHGKYQLLTGQNHDVKAEVIAPVLSEFYGSPQN
jgi:hypothetical protein